MRSTSSRARKTTFEAKLGSGQVEKIHENLIGVGNDLAARLLVAFHCRAFFNHAFREYKAAAIGVLWPYHPHST